MKAKITAERLYVYRSRGVENGYGITPNAAFRDSQKRSKKRLLMNTTIKNLAKDLNRRQADFEHLDSRFSALQSGINAKINEKSTQEWVMMACLVFGKTPSMAIKEMARRGAKIGQAERDAAIAVEELIIAWLEELKP